MPFVGEHEMLIRESGERCLSTLLNAPLAGTTSNCTCDRRPLETSASRVKALLAISSSIKHCRHFPYAESPAGGTRRPLMRARRGVAMLALHNLTETGPASDPRDRLAYYRDMALKYREAQ